MSIFNSVSQFYFADYDYHTVCIIEAFVRTSSKSDDDYDDRENIDKYSFFILVYRITQFPAVL